MSVCFVEFMMTNTFHPQPFSRNQAEYAANLFRMVGFECGVREFSIDGVPEGNASISAKMGGFPTHPGEV